MSDQTLSKTQIGNPKNKKDKPITFTERESQCATQVMQGKNLSQIAECLRISERSVCFYMTGVKKKFEMLALCV